MLINSINEINLNVYQTKKTFKKENSLTRNNSNALQSELNFMGLVNQSAAISPEAVYQKYLKVLGHYRGLSGTSILYVKESETHSNIMMLDKPLKIDKALAVLKEKIIELEEMETAGKVKLPFYSSLKSDNFDIFKAAVTKGGIPNLKIKGIIGQGRCSTAFLTDDNKVLKLSIVPSFPSKKYFMKGIDFPIECRYISRNIMGGKHTVYGILQELAEVFPVEVSLNEPRINVYSYFGPKIKAINPNYSFQDFDAKQTCKFNGCYYILDYECVHDRPLVQ